MNPPEQDELPLLAAYLLGAGLANVAQVALILRTTPARVIALARDARVGLGNVTSFQRWIMRSNERSEAWAALHQALRGVRFGDARP